MPVSSRENIRNVLANPTSPEDVALKPMWLNLIALDPTNLDDIESAKAKVVLYGESGSDKTENMLDLLDDAYGSLDAGRQSNLGFYFVDKVENSSVAAIYGVNQFPTLLFFIFGIQLKKVIGEISNIQLQDHLEDFFKKSDWVAERMNKIIWNGGELQVSNGDFEIQNSNIEWSGNELNVSNGDFEIQNSNIEWSGNELNVSNGSWSIEEV